MRDVAPKPEPLVNPKVLQDVVAQCERAILGKRSVVEDVLTSILAGGHVLLEDVPGVGKTTLCRAMSHVLGCQFRRIQFTSDLLPADVIGVQVLDGKDGGLRFRPGPIFSNLILADEINRASPKTQSALLEAMSDRQVTVDDVTHYLSAPFIVMATQNPVEHHGAYPLPESQLDRFALRLEMGYPDLASERELLLTGAGSTHVEKLSQLLDPPRVVVLQEMVGAVRVDPAVADYLLAICRRTREHPAVTLGCSPRGATLFLRAVKARAFLHGRNFALPDDVKSLAHKTLCHRLMMRGGLEGRDARDAANAVIQEILDTQEVPA